MSIHEVDNPGVWHTVTDHVACQVRPRRGRIQNETVRRGHDVSGISQKLIGVSDELDLPIPLMQVGLLE